MRKLTLLATWLGLFALGLVMLTACGGDDDTSGSASSSSGGGGDDGAGPGSSDDGDSGADSGEGEGDASDDGGQDDGGDSFDFGTGFARVTIGDTTYEFDLTAQFVVCREVFGAIQVGGTSAENENVSIDAWIPPTDWESYTDGRYDPPSITVEHVEPPTNSQWRADQGRVELIDDWPEESRVNSYEKDGLRASGTATFIDDYDFDGDREPVSGTFEIGCEE